MSNLTLLRAWKVFSVVFFSCLFHVVSCSIAQMQHSVVSKSESVRAQNLWDMTKCTPQPCGHDTLEQG